MPNFGDFCRSVPGNHENRHPRVKQARAQARGAHSLRCMPLSSHLWRGIEYEGEWNTALAVLVLIRHKFPERRGPSVMSKAGELDGLGSGLPVSFTGCHIAKVTFRTCGPISFLSSESCRQCWYEKMQFSVAWWLFTLQRYSVKTNSCLPSRSHVRCDVGSLHAQRGEWFMVGRRCIIGVRS